MTWIDVVGQQDCITSTKTGCFGVEAGAAVVVLAAAVWLLVCWPAVVGIYAAIRTELGGSDELD